MPALNGCSGRALNGCIGKNHANTEQVFMDHLKPGVRMFSGRAAKSAPPHKNRHLVFTHYPCHHWETVICYTRGDESRLRARLVLQHI